jgi:hypothetical protein
MRRIGELSLFLTDDPLFPLSIVIRGIPVKPWMRRDVGFLTGAFVKGYAHEVPSRAVVT